MRKLSTLAIVSAACACTANAQMGRSLDWPTYGGDAQRTGWEKADSKFKKEDLAKEFQFLWKVKPEGRGPRTLMTPVIIGNLIGYRGFKELAFIAGSDDSLHVMDADLNRTYWQRHFETSGKPKATSGCTGGMTAMPTLMAIGFRRPGPRPAPGAAPARPAPNPMFGPRAIYVISSDGKLHRVNVAHGEDTVPAVPVLPPNAKASTLNMNDNVIYTTTSEGCGGAPNAVWAIDLANPNPQGAPTVNSFVSGGGNFVGLGGPVIGNDGTIYVQAGDGPSDPAANKYSNALLALSPKDLKLKGYFSAPAGAVSPVVFAHNGHDLIVTGGKDGRLYLVDSTSMGGEDHRTALSQTAPIAGAGGALWGGLSTWQEQDGPRWVLATVWGPLKDGAAKHGSIVAFKLEEQDGKPVLTPVWTSVDLVKPAPPVIANGVVFALANGERQTHATLHALDALSGKELWSTGNQVSASGNMTGLTIANGRVYFATTDNTLWAFGVPLEW